MPGPPAAARGPADGRARLRSRRRATRRSPTTPFDAAGRGPGPRRPRRPAPHGPRTMPDLRTTRRHGRSVDGADRTRPRRSVASSRRASTDAVATGGRRPRRPDHGARSSGPPGWRPRLRPAGRGMAARARARRRSPITVAANADAARRRRSVDRGGDGRRAAMTPHRPARPARDRGRGPVGRRQRRSGLDDRAGRRGGRWRPGGRRRGRGELAPTHGSRRRRRRRRRAPTSGASPTSAAQSRRARAPGAARGGRRRCARPAAPTTSSLTRAARRGATADPRAVRAPPRRRPSARFRDARAARPTRDDVEAAARDWLTEINRINIATRDGGRTADSTRAGRGTDDRPRPGAPGSLEADAARIAAETADAACVAARGRRRRAATSATRSIAAAVAQRRAPLRAGAAGPMTTRSSRSAIALGRPGGDAAHLPDPARRPRGDDARWSPRSPATTRPSARRWQSACSAGCVEAIVAGRHRGVAPLEFPADHSFWGAVHARSRTATSPRRWRRSATGSTGSAAGPTTRIPPSATCRWRCGYAGLDPMRDPALADGGRDRRTCYARRHGRRRRVPRRRPPAT